MIHSCDDTLLRLVRAAPEPEAPPPRVVGIDDWAQRKGQTYGTILVDLERHAVVDVLEERSAESAAEWFRAHPGIEVISRDRGNEYIQGATQGAPEAIQVADRWHLLKNLREALERLLEQKPQVLKAAASKPEAAPTEDADEAPVADDAPVVQNHPEPEPAFSDGVVSTQLTQEELLRQARHDRRQAHYQRVKELADEGLSYSEIGRQTGLDRRTVKKYHLSPTCPVIPARGNSVSKVAVYGDYVAQRVSEGCETMADIWCELTALGFDGSYSSVRRWMNRAHPSFASSNRQPAPKAIVPWSVCRGSWLLTKSEEKLSEEEKQALEQMQQSDAQIGAAHRLAQRFVEMFRQRKPDALDPWLEDATQSGIQVLKGFAQSLCGDIDAVRNALRLPWSQGQVEGQVNRLKMIKRSMFGRANVDLLRKKVMGCSLVT